MSLLLEAGSVLLEAGSEARFVIYHLAIQAAAKGETITKEGIEAALVCYGYATPDNLPDGVDWEEAIWPWIGAAKKLRVAILGVFDDPEYEVALGMIGDPEYEAAVAAGWIALAMQSVAEGEIDPRNGLRVAMQREKPIHG